MSGSVPCNCDERLKPLAERRWRVRHYRCNYSAFNGYHHTSSDYSNVTCEVCQGTWRTKAAYVEKLLGG